MYSLRTNGKALFLLCDYDSRKSEGTPYKSGGGSSRKKIADDVNSVSVYSKMVIYETDDEYYISTDGNKFEKVG